MNHETLVHTFTCIESIQVPSEYDKRWEQLRHAPLLLDLLGFSTGLLVVGTEQVDVVIIVVVIRSRSRSGLRVATTAHRRRAVLIERLLHAGEGRAFRAVRVDLVEPTQRVRKLGSRCLAHCLEHRNVGLRRDVSATERT